MVDHAGPGMIQDPVAILAYLAAVVGVVFQLGRLDALRPLFDRLPPLVWAYFLPMLSTTAGLLPDESALYRALARYLLPASLVLMLLSSDIRAVARLGRTALLAMAAGVAGILLGVLVSFFLFRPWLPPEGWKAMGALAGTWIGGSANLLAVGTTLGLSPELQGVIIVVDTVVGYTWMGVLISLAAHQDRVDRWLGADRSRIDEVSARLRDREGRARVPSVPDVAALVALALVLTAVCLWPAACSRRSGACSTRSPGASCSSPRPGWRCRSRRWRAWRKWARPPWATPASICCWRRSARRPTCARCFPIRSSCCWARS
jgi:uncharacterized membrane protein